MGSVLKGNRYRLVDNSAFELPLSVKYVLFKEDIEIAEYEVVNNEKVSCKIITKYKENMITPIDRPLTISDIYYFFSTRVFQDRTPFTETELSLLGLDRYNVYNIIRKTRGVTPYDNYWLKFDGDKCDFEKAKAEWDKLMSKIIEPPAPSAQNVSAPASDANVNEILNQHKVDVASKLTEGTENTAPVEQKSAPKSEPAPKPEPPAPAPVQSNTMSADEIEALLAKTGVTGSANDHEDDEDDNEPASSSGGTMSQADIEAMLAAAGGTVEEPAPAPVEEKKPSGGKMSQDDIEKMLAAASEAVQEPIISEPVQETLDEAPAPVEEKKPSGGKMSQADIEALLNGMQEDVK